MSLQDKYKPLLDAARASGITGLQVSEQDNVLHINGEAPDGGAKDQLWNIYNQIDPDFRTGDLILNVDVAAAAGTKAKVTTDSTALNIRKGPGTDQPVVGKAGHGETVTLQSKTNNQWWLIKTDAGVEGYAYAQYLSPE
jgi:Bacterial SH3 domain